MLKNGNPASSESKAHSATQAHYPVPISRLDHFRAATGFTGSALARKKPPANTAKPGKPENGDEKPVSNTLHPSNVETSSPIPASKIPYPTKANTQSNTHSHAHKKARANRSGLGYNNSDT